MTYRRVLPRDAFNEADLMKCIGRLWILLDETSGHEARIVEEDLPRFQIEQDEGSGAIHVANLTFEVRGVRHPLHRPLNARSKWPLWVEAPEGDEDFDAIRVFDDDGALSEDMRELIGLPRKA